MLDGTSSISGARERPPPLRVLLVENHADTRQLLRLMLEALGHAVVATENMHGALEALEGTEFDVLISDIGLPDGDGWELMRRLHLARPLYAVAISGYGMSSDCALSRSVGYRYHLVKPYGIEQLPSILREAARERGQPPVRRYAPEH